MKEQIVIVGFGWVGQANALALSRMGYSVAYFDPGSPSRHYEKTYAEDYGRLTRLKSLREIDSPSTVYVVCVGDRVSEDGVQDISSIERALVDLKGAKGRVVLRSTVIPGSLAALPFDFYVPEFLHEKKAVEECITPYYFVVGRNTPNIPEPQFFAEWQKKALRTFYGTPKEASHIKYLSNLWNALRIAFANEYGSTIREPDSKEAVDEIEHVMRFLFEDKPYLRYGRSFGGHCLPKDTRAYVHWNKTRGQEVPLIESMLSSNALHITREGNFPNLPEWFSEWQRPVISGFVALQALGSALARNATKPFRRSHTASAPIDSTGEAGKITTPMTKVLITGGSGFIGYHLANHLLDRGYEVVLTDNFFRGRNDADFEMLLKRAGVSFVEADLTKRTEWDKLGGGYEHVYHLAAVNGTGLFYDIPHEVLRINIESMFNAAEWMRDINKGGKLLFTSSNELYAGARESFDSLPIPTPENVPAVIPDIQNPRWTYASSKLIGEQICIHYANAYNFRMVIVRPHNFYGPRAGYNHVIPQLIERIEKKADPFPIYGLEDKRSFCYIDDAVRAMRLVMESPRTDGGTYHIGSEEERKIMNVAEVLFNTMQFIPKQVIKHQSPAGSVKRRLPDIAKLKRDIDWEHETTFEEGIKKTIDWYQRNPKPEK